jgi:hypothetical protein
MVKPRIVLLIFVSGKVVLTGENLKTIDPPTMVNPSCNLQPSLITHTYIHYVCFVLSSGYLSRNSRQQAFQFDIFFPGAKVRGEIYEAFENIYPILKSFKKQ